MKRLVGGLLVLALATPAAAWEADTTHAGLTEVAALESRLHDRLREHHGRRAGWLELLAVARDRAPAMHEKLEAVEPSSGVVPDRRGRQSALAWLVAGAVLEGIPGDRDRNHFYDPANKKGLGEVRAGLLGWLRGARTVPGGVAAPDWIVASENDLGLSRFWVELEQSAVAPTRAERDEHLALALLCAGAMLHVLQDLGAPAHTRGDVEEHLLPLGGGPADRGSRFERLAAWLYGRLGLPAPAEVPARERARDFFTAADGKGLADVTASRWYSAGTLPGDVLVPADPRRGEMEERVVAAQRHPLPRPTSELRVKASPPGPDGHVLRDGDGPCLANYRVERGVVRFTISDACAAEQLAVILPEIAGYSRGFLEWLFRGGLAVSVGGGVVTVSLPPGERPLGDGKVTVLVEDAEGRRTVLARADVTGGTLPTVTASPTGARVVAVFRGKDGAGEEVVAVGSAAL